MRRLTVLLLLQVVAVFSTQGQKPVTGDRDIHDVGETDDYRGSQSGPDVHPESDTPPFREPGADLVDAALIELRKIPNKTHRKRHLPAGVIGHVISFILNGLPSLSITSGPEKAQHVTTGPLHEAVGLLQQAAFQNNSDALYLLADMHFYGNYSHPRDLHAAYNLYDKLAGIHGNTTAQFMLGLYHSTGIGNVVPRNSAKSLMNYMYAAMRGDTRAEMAIGYRYHAAIGVPKNCEMACSYYKRVADKAMDWFRSGPPGGMSWVQESWRIADDYGGAYGKGASAASSGINANKASVNSDTNAAVEDVIEYLDLMSQKGDDKSSLNLGRIYYDGQRGIDRDLELAKKYFYMVAKRYWKKDGRTFENYKRGTEKYAAKAAGFIGRMHLRGDGVEQNFDKAKMWFDRGKAQGDAQSQHGLGLMLLNGYGVPRNVALATQLFKAAAEQDYAPAQVELGVLYLDQGGAEDVRVASNYFELAARYGLIEAHYYLAEMLYYGVGRDKTCGMALQYYKGVAEKAEPLVSTWSAANQAFEHGDQEGAMLQYLIMAEQGYERAQNNVAHLLDPDQSRLQLSHRLAIDLPFLGRHKHRSPLLQDPGMALLYWTRSSRQGNVDSMVKMGDYYFYGIGADTDLNKAVQCYQGASDYSQSAQALYNLGWMHENGMGLTQDFHLAKRYYDQALEVNDEAYLPVTLSLLKLRMRSAWNTFTHGPIHSIQDDPKPKKDWSLNEWIINFFQDDILYYEDGLPYEDDIFDDSYGPDPDLDGDDGGMEVFLIFGVAAALVGLLYYRQYRQQQNRQQEEQDEQDEQDRQDGQQNGGERRRQGLDRGLFPQPGDAGFANWGAGGIGH